MAFGDDVTLAFFAISIAALIYSAVANLLIQKIGNRERAKQIQDEMSRVNKLAEEAMKSGNEKKKKEAEDAQAKMPGLLKESMILQFKPMLVVLPVWYLLAWALKQAFPAFEVKLSFALPIVIQNLENFPNWRDTFGVNGWFILAILFGGLLMQFIVGKMKEILKKK